MSSNTVLVLLLSGEKRGGFYCLCGGLHFRRHLDEHLHHLRIERAAGFLLEQRHRRLGRHCLVVRTV
jgi:hypothetical protein